MKAKREEEPQEKRGVKDYITDTALVITLGVVTISLAAMLVFGPN